MSDKIDYGLAILEADQEFIILPDRTTVRFESTGPLLKYLNDEIAAWQNADGGIRNQYVQTRDELVQIVKNVGENGLAKGTLNGVKNRLGNGSIGPDGIHVCISSQSRFGQWLLSYKAKVGDTNISRLRASAAACVALGVTEFNYNLNGTWALAVADAAVRFGSVGALGEDVEQYKCELSKLSELSVKQRADFDSRVADFEMKKSAFEADRKKQFEDDKTKFADHLRNAEDAARQFEADYRTRVNVLEDTYTKLLQLKGPAECWNELSKSYRKRGWWLLGAVVVIGGVVFASLLALLFDCDKLPLLNRVKFDAATVRASLIFIVLTSVAGYLIHLFTRLSISSFHLARDYRERFQLTRVYLALIKDGDLQNNDTARQIVLQSLFSRSDTGLLKGDHSLTMPMAIGDVIKGNG